MAHPHLLLHQEFDTHKTTAITFPSYPEAYKEMQNRLARDKWRMEWYHFKATKHSYNIYSFTGQKSKLKLIRL